MKAWPKSLLMFVGGCTVALGMTAMASEQKVNEAVQSIQQAPDPSAVISAYANGFAADRNDSRLYDAFVSRMVELGLPEMAYHQAETLSTLQSSNGLAWGVIAYVDARRGQMPEAVAAISLAGQFAPENKFIQHTAGEILAWYDFKADKNQIPNGVSAGLAKVRGLLDKCPDFTQAYSTAQKAYQSQSSSPSQPAPVPSIATPSQAGPAPEISNASPAAMGPQAFQGDQIAPLGYAPPSTFDPQDAPAYYGAYPADYSSIYLDWGPSYCYDWGAGWVAPAPWCWWQPCGFWAGCGFVPFGVGFCFGNSYDFHHHGFGHDEFAHNGMGHDGFGRGGQLGRKGHFGYGSDRAGGRDPAAWHHGAPGHNSFFGTPARPSSPAVQWARSGAMRAEPFVSPGATAKGGQWWSSSRPAAVGDGLRTIGPQNHFALSDASRPIGSLAAEQRGPNFVSPAVSRPSIMSGSRNSQSSVIPGSSVSQRANTLGEYRGNIYSTPSFSRTLPTHPQNYRAAPSYSPSYRTAPAPSYTSRAPVYRTPSYGYTTRAASSGGRSFGNYGRWQNSAPSYAAPRSSGSTGGFRSGSSFSGGFHGGGFASGGGGFHGGGGGFGGSHSGGGGHR